MKALLSSSHPAHIPMSLPRSPQACRRVWLGTFDPRTSLLPDSCDPQKVKEFLQEKYEKKRWYKRSWGRIYGGQYSVRTPQSIFCPPLAGMWHQNSFTY